MVKKRSLLFLIMGVIFGCLFACGVFAVASSVKFKMGITLKPNVFFALSVQINNGAENFIFDNTLTHDVVSWSKTNNLTITLNNSELAEATNIKLNVYNLTSSKYMTFKIYDTSGGVITPNNPNGLNNIAFNTPLALELTPSAIENTEYKFKMLVDTYDAEVESFATSVNYISYPRAFVNDSYRAYIENDELGIVVTQVKVGGNVIPSSNYAYSEDTKILTINQAAITGKIEIFTQPKCVVANLCVFDCSATLDTGEVFTDETRTQVAVTPGTDLVFTITNCASNYEGVSCYVTRNGDKTPFSTNLDGKIEITIETKLFTYGDKIIIVITALTPWESDTSASEEYAFGTGTSDDPFLISTAEQFAKLAQDSTEGNSYYRGQYLMLTNDIIFNDGHENWSSWDENTTGLNNWPGVTNLSGYFSGNMNKIYGLYMNAIGDTGLFRSGNNGTTLTNIILESGFVVGTGYTGGICGYSNGRILKCFNKLTVKQITNNANYGIGGIAGTVRYVKECINQGLIDTSQRDSGVEYHTGGICGSLSGYVVGGSYIVNSYNLGTVLGRHNVAGIAGCNGGWANGGGQILRCYNTGALSSVYRSGSIVGLNCGPTGEVQYCYYASGSAVSGNSGANGAGTVANNALLSAATYNTWDFTNVWGWIDGYDYPVLRCFYPDARATK